MELMKLMTTHDFDPAKAIDDGMLPITSVGISTFRMNLQAFHEHLEAVLEKMEDKLDEEDNEDHRRDQETERTVRARHSEPESLVCTSGSEQLEKGTVFAKALDEYKATADFLISKGYYQGAFESVENCFDHDNTFMIVDSPSGSGKTLFGIALNQHFSKEELKTQVIHLIWPEAVRDQTVYDQLNADYDRLVRSSIFFSNIRSFNFPEMKIVGNRFESIWEATLKYLFPEGFDPRQFQTGEKRLLLFFDEMPADPYSAGLMGKLRDLLKELKYVRLCLSGTNSKAANMVGLSQGSASSTDRNGSGSAWAVIITRLPSFDVDCPPIFNRWKSIEAKQELRLIVNCIRCSIVNGGNARSIAMAINCAEALNVVEIENAEECLDSWQIEFSKAVTRNKFDKTSYSETSKGLMGQLNMLLDASHDPDISDVLLSHHFAIRAIPDNGATISSKPNAKFGDIGGWLFLATDTVRGLGSSLYFVAGPCMQSYCAFKIPENGTILWQKTVFARPESDCLLFLAAVREKGYFFTNLVEYRTWQVVQAFWRNHAAGSVNFQNSLAVLNTGSSMEVLLAVAIPNAAASSKNTTVHLGYQCTEFLRYIGLFCIEIGISKAKSGLAKLDCAVLKEIAIPRIVIPSSAILPILHKGVGSLSRQPNKDKFDLLLQVPNSSGGVTKLRFEAKSREKLSTAEIATAGKKLIDAECNVGVLVVSNCCQFWGEKKHNKRKRADLGACLAGNGSFVGTVIFINDVGSIAVEKYGSNAGCLFLIKVPASSLHQL